MTTLTTKLARAYIDKATQQSVELGISVCIAVVDSGNHLVAFERMDNAFLGSIDIAIQKAKTSALFPLDSGTLGDLIRDKKLTGFELSNQHLMAFPGGIPIVVNDTQIGAIGVSGGSAEQDVTIARAALN